VFEMLLVGAVALCGVAVITQIVHRRESGWAQALRAASPEPVTAPEPHDMTGAFAMVLRHRYLALIAAFSLVFSIVNTNGEYMVGKLIKAAAALEVERGTLSPTDLVRFIAARFNTYFQWTSWLSFGLQFLVVSRLIRWAGFGRAFFILPVIALLDGVAVTIAPVLTVLFIGKIVENSTDYSLNNTLRNMLWLPTTREMKYKAKQAVDTFFVRMGDVASGAWVVLGATVLQLGVRVFAITNVVLAVVWLWLAWAIAREHEKLESTRAEAPVT
jgi:AAA family ATP:ADP antiporter